MASGRSAPTADSGENDTAIDDPIVEPKVRVADAVDGPSDEPVANTPLFAQPLAKSQIVLSNGTEVGVSVSGQGVPLVVVHGFAAEGVLYTQTLARLVGMGFKVVAIDSPGHGGTTDISALAKLEDYAELLHKAVSELGIKQAVFIGHSMGGRLVTQLAANHPDMAIGVVLLDAIVGDDWDKMIDVFRLAPPVAGAAMAVLMADAVSTLPVFRRPDQALKLARLMFPTTANHVRRPWRLIGPSLSILRSRRSTEFLDRLAEAEVPLFVIHGDRDYAVPVRTAHSAADRGRGDLVIVHGATHSWLLKDPESLPAILGELLQGRLGKALVDALDGVGIKVSRFTAADTSAVEAELYDDDALVFELTPDAIERRRRGRHRRPRYTWTTSPLASRRS